MSKFSADDCGEIRKACFADFLGRAELFEEFFLFGRTDATNIIQN